MEFKWRGCKQTIWRMNFKQHSRTLKNILLCVKDGPHSFVHWHHSELRLNVNVRWQTVDKLNLFLNKVTWDVNVSRRGGGREEAPRAEATPPPWRRCPFVLHSWISSDNTASHHPTRPDPTRQLRRCTQDRICVLITPENIAGFCSSGSQQHTSCVNVPGRLINLLHRQQPCF